MIGFFLAVFGAVSLIGMLVKDTPLDRKPFNCHLCMGFWIGCLFLLVRLLPHHEDLFLVFQTAGACWMLNKFVTGRF